MDEDLFFKRYEKHSKKVSGIPGLTMNAPVVALTKKGTVGLELEVEGKNLRLGEGHFEGVKAPRSRAQWLSHEDGSLRNGGREFVLSAPIFVDEIDDMLQGLFSQIAAYKGVIENTNRCSTHVHINVGGKKINEITSAMALWYMFETAAIAWCGEERVSNHFCLSNVEAPSTMQAWSQYLRTGRRPSQEGLKYSALNVLPIWRFGSIEFRCGQAAHEPTRPAQWSKFLASLVDYACEEFQNPESIAAACSEIGSSRILKNICDKAGLSGAFADSMINSSSDFDGECLRNLRNCQSIILGVPWNNWMELIDRDYVPNPFGSKGPTKAPREVPFPEEVPEEWGDILGNRPARAPGGLNIRRGQPRWVPREDDAIWDEPAQPAVAQPLAAEEPMDHLRVQEILREHPGFSIAQAMGREADERRARAGRIRVAERFNEIIRGN